MSVPETAPIATSNDARGLSLPGLLLASLIVHLAAAGVLAAIPVTERVANGLDAGFFEIDLRPLPEPAPLVEETPPPPVRELEPEPEPEQRHVRSAPREVVTPEPIAEQRPEPIAPPSIDDVFAEEAAPPAASLTTDGVGAFGVAPGEPGGVPGGTPGGHGTALTTTVRASAASVPTGPSEADRRRARRSYVRIVEDLLRAHTHYPRAAERAGLEGRVELALRIGSDGRITATRVARGSGHDMLDRAAVEAANELGRVPPPPALAALTESDELRVGVVYVVR